MEGSKKELASQLLFDWLTLQLQSGPHFPDFHKGYNIISKVFSSLKYIIL
jgi:hypothetical protein